MQYHARNPCLKSIVFPAMVFLAMALPTLCGAAPKAQRAYADALAATSDSERGAELYAHCVSCHGSDGTGTLDGSIPRLAGQHYRVLIRQLIDFRYGKRWDFRMEEVASDRHALVGAQDIADVAAHLAGLTQSAANGMGDGTQLARGATVYGGHCQSCHGIHGEGDAARAIPKIGGQHAGYLMRQIYDSVDGRRIPLATTHRKRFLALDFEDVRGLCDFIARAGWQDLPPPAPRNPPPYDTSDR